MQDPQSNNADDADVNNNNNNDDDDSDVAATPDPDPYVLPATSRQLDARYRERLDADTRLRRRVYEMMLVAGNARLERLDGLVVERGDGEGGVQRKDGVWERLVGLGVVRVRVEEDGGGEGGVKDEERKEA